MLFDRIMRRARRGESEHRPDGVAAAAPDPGELPDADAIARFNAATAWARADTRLLTLLVDGLRREQSP
ncbi:hypothetical protein CS0771_41530 [Catellatospora sp. IY07-71]|uniref:hypothetical protein n=1 Tax=Catellatospora sp. IY07-71 TaxID=2728827 RepID=UPI001BB37812|nr:hypothetical protein [Catellatospora sp. IY07-71]BCJ74609.1 hypothetical protein CS0771_41530 [Catellatospora sp. IY07-71]